MGEGSVLGRFDLSAGAPVRREGDKDEAFYVVQPAYVHRQASGSSLG